MPYRRFARRARVYAPRRSPATLRVRARALMRKAPARKAMYRKPAYARPRMYRK